MLRCPPNAKGDSPGEQFHLNNPILPTAAIYKALLEMDRGNALAVTHEALIGLCRMGSRVMQMILYIPGMKRLFMRPLPKMALKMFGRECGFDYEHFCADRSRLEMDTTVCTYCRFARLLDVEELMPTFCERDFATCGSLPGIRFERTQTLGTGGRKCDFRFIRKKG